MENLNIDLFSLEIGKFETDNLIAVGKKTVKSFKFNLSILTLYTDKYDIITHRRSLFGVSIENNQFDLYLLWINIITIRVGASDGCEVIFKNRCEL